MRYRDRATWPGRGSTRGFTLIELIACIAILWLVAGLAVPGALNMFARTRADGAMQQLFALLGFARQNAIALHREVTLCGTLDGTSCAGTWDGQPTLVFVDANRDRRLGENERLLLTTELTRAARIRWRATGNRSYLRYQPDGGIGEFGHFLYCPESRDPRHARQLILNITGRPRFTRRDADRDGVFEDSNGAPLDCGSR